MSRQPKGDKVDGWLVLDKPVGLTSAQAVGRVRRLLNAAKAGHAGTLDPLATGVLPIALGEATKTVAWAVAGAKIYRFTVRWGEARSSDDAEGEVVAASACRPSTAEIAALLPRFRGEISQVPPAFSAVKIGGRRAYQRARAGAVLALAARTVRIDRFDLEAVPDPDHAIFRVECGKGTYIRALARDLARALGTHGHLAALRRLAVGKFSESLAIPLEMLEALGHIRARLAYLHPVETALDDIPALAVTEEACLRLKQGQAVPIPGAANRGAGAWRSGQVVCATLSGRPVALAEVDGDTLRPRRVLNL